MQLGTFSSTLGPVQLELSANPQYANLHLTRDGLSGSGQGQGSARIVGARTETLKFSHRMSGNSYSFDVGARGPDLLELLAATQLLTVSPLTASETKAEGVAALFMSSAPRFNVTLGDINEDVRRIATCNGYLAGANKAGFCTHVLVFQANQGCIVSAWRMAARNDQQIDWVDTNHVTRNGPQIEFTILTEHGSQAQLPRPEDRYYALRGVTGDCSNRNYTTRAFISLDGSNQEIAMYLAQPASPQDVLVDQDLKIACAMAWRSAVVDDPAASTRQLFGEQQARHDEQHMFKRY